MFLRPSPPPPPFSSGDDDGDDADFQLAHVDVYPNMKVSLLFFNNFFRPYLVLQCSRFIFFHVLLLVQKKRQDDNGQKFVLVIHASAQLKLCVGSMSSTVVAAV